MCDNNKDFHFKDMGEKTLLWEGRCSVFITRFIQKHTSREGKRKPKRQIKKSDIKWAWS